MASSAFLVSRACWRADNRADPVCQTMREADAMVDTFGWSGGLNTWQELK